MAVTKVTLFLVMVAAGVLMQIGLGQQRCDGLQENTFANLLLGLLDGVVDKLTNDKPNKDAKELCRAEVTDVTVKLEFPCPIIIRDYLECILLKLGIDIGAITGAQLLEIERDIENALIKLKIVCKIRFKDTITKTTPTTAAPTTEAPTTDATKKAAPTTAAQTTAASTTAASTTAAPSTAAPKTAAPSTAAPTTAAPKTAAPTTTEPTTAAPKTAAPTTTEPTTTYPTPTKKEKITTTQKSGGLSQYPGCLRQFEKNCKGKSNGNYPLCFPDCLSGDFITCSNGYTHVMQCAPNTPSNKGFGTGDNKYDVLVYDPIFDKCERSSDYCPYVPDKDYYRRK